MEGAQRPAPAVKGQAVVAGSILGAHPLPTFLENINQ